jgi:hypothetical protein
VDYSLGSFLLSVVAHLLMLDSVPVGWLVDVSFGRVASLSLASLIFFFLSALSAVG